MNRHHKKSPIVFDTTTHRKNCKVKKSSPLLSYITGLVLLFFVLPNMVSATGLPTSGITVTENDGTPNDGIICSGTSATLTACPGVSYQWISANGPMSNSITVNPSMDTNYSVTVTDANGNTTVDDITIIVPFSSNSSVITVSENDGTPNDGTICSGSSATLAAPSDGVAFQWISANGPMSNSITVNPSVNTDYALTVTDINGCTAVKTISIIVPFSDNSSVITVSENDGIPNDGTICSGSSATLTAPSDGVAFQWISANGPTSNSITVNPSIDTDYALTVTDINGCTAEETITILVSTFNGNIITINENDGPPNDGIICEGSSATLTATMGEFYQWIDVSLGLTSSSITVNPIVDTDYSITITDSNGCTAEETVLISIPFTGSGSMISIFNDNDGLVNDGTICEGSSVKLQAPNGDNYTWNDGSSDQCLNVTPNSNTNYSVTVTDANGCSTIETVAISVPLTGSGSIITVMETDGIDNDGIICDGSSATLTATMGDFYSWDDPSNSTSQMITVMPNMNSNYTVTVSDINGCSAVESVAISVPLTGSGSIITLMENDGIPNDGIICSGSTVNLTAPQGDSYMWNDPNNSTSQMIAVMPTVNTDYAVTVTANQDCSSVDMISVFVNPTPDISIADPGIQCNEFDLNNLMITDTNASAGTTTSFHSAAPSSATDFSTQITTTINTDQTVFVLVANPTTGCFDVESIAIDIDASPTISLVSAPICSADLMTYSLTISVTNGNTITTTTTSSTEIINDNNDGSFTITNITTGEDIAISATNTTSNCSTPIPTEITAPNCVCPTIDAPSNPINQEICAGDAIPALSIDNPGAGFSITWWDAASGGNLVSGATLGGTNNSEVTLSTTSIPAIPDAGNSLTIYAEVIEDNSGCTSASRTAVVLTINENPTISVTTAAACSADLMTYSLTISVTNGNTITTTTTSSTEIINDNNDGSFTITNITTGEDIAISATNTTSNCSTPIPTEITAPNCVCPTIDAPSNPINQEICAGDAIPALSIDNPGAGFSITWWDAASGGNLVSGATLGGTNNSEVTLSTTSIPAIPDAGNSLTIYAEVIEDNSGCTSASRTAVVLTINENPTISVTTAAACSADLMTYSLTISVTNGNTITTTTTSSTEIINDNNDGSFTITNITTGEDIAISATNTTSNCSTPIPTEITAPNCVCPTIDAPSNPINQEICAGDAIPALSIDNPGAGFSITWWDAASGGNLVSGATLGGTNNSEVTLSTTSIPAIPDAGNNLAIYAEVIEDNSGCTSASRTAVVLTINENPTISVTTAAACSADLMTYSLTISVTNGNTITTTTTSSTEIINDNNDGSFTITNITTGEDIAISATNTITNCLSLSPTIVASPDCPCPVISSPMNPMGATICDGEVIPAITVDDPGAGFTIAWWNALVGGNQVTGGTIGGSNNESLTLSTTSNPAIPTAGNTTIVYAEVVETISGCTSNPRIPVTLTIEANPTINITAAATCSADLLTYALTISVSNGNTITTTTTSSTEIITDNGNSSFTISNIQTGENISITASDTGTTCVSDNPTVVLAPDCACPSPPTNPSNQVICDGEMIPALSVDDPGTGLTITWWDAATGGNAVSGVTFGGTNNNEITLSAASSPASPMAGNTTTVYAEVVDNNSTACMTSSRIPLTLTINTNPSINITTAATCSADLMTYAVSISVANGNSIATTTASSTEIITDNGNGSFTISNIQTGENISITATNTVTTCSTVMPTEIMAPDCVCPTINAPTNPTDQAICDGAMIPVLSVDDPGAGLTITWWDAATGGNLVSGAIIGGTNNNEITLSASSIPASPSIGNTTTVYAEVLANNGSMCTSSTRTAVNLTIDFNPSISITSAATCSTDLLTYSLTISVANGNTITTTTTSNTETITDNGSGSFTIDNIAASENISISATNTTTTCTSPMPTEITAPNCACPTIDAPSNPIDQAICDGDAIPALSVDDPGTGLTITWWDAATGGNPVSGATFGGTNNTEITLSATSIPAIPNAGNSLTIYAEVIENNSGCTSNSRTAVVLTINENPSLTVNTAAACASDLQSYSLSVSIANGNTISATTISNSQVIVDNNDGSYTINNITLGESINITAVNSTTNCSSAILQVFSPTCPCAGIPTAANPIDATICEGDVIPALSVDDPGAGYSIFWYNAPTGGGFVSGAPFGSPNNSTITLSSISNPPAPSAGNTTIVYAEVIALDGSGCVSPTRTAVSLTIQASPTLAITTAAACATGSATYDLTVSVTNGTSITTTTTSGTEVITDNGGGSFTISNITAGENISIDGINTMTNCSTPTPLLVTAPDCGCAFIAAPSNPIDGNICAGENSPTLSVDVPTGFTTTWWDAASGGNQVSGATISGTTNNEIVLNTNSTPALPSAGNTTTIYAETNSTDGSGCTSTARTAVELSVFANPNPIIEASINNSTLNTNSICAQDIGTANGTILLDAGIGYTSYLWNDVNASTTQSISVLPTTTTTYSVTVMDNNGCEGIETITITVEPSPNPIITMQDSDGVANDGIICNGSSVSLTASGGDTYLWDDPSGNNTNTLTVNPNSNTTYTVIVSNSNTGCSASLSASIQVNTIPQTNPTYNPICLDGTQDFMLFANPSATYSNYQWSGPNGFSSNDENPVVPASDLSNLFSGTYTLVTTGVSGCSNSETVFVFLPDMPNAPSLSVNNPITCLGNEVTITASTFAGSNINYTWQIDNDSAISTLSNEFTFTPDGNTNVQVFATVNGCNSAVANILVETSSFDNSAITINSSNTTSCGGSDGNIIINGLNTGTYSISFVYNGGSVQNIPAIPASNGMLSIIGLSAGSYTDIIIEDANGCISSPLSASILDANFDTSGFSLAGSDPSTCGANDGIILVTGLNNGTTYTINYLVNGVMQTDFNLLASNNSISIQNVAAGVLYSNFNILDASSNCSSPFNGSISLNEPQAVDTPILDATASICEGNDYTFSIDNPAMLGAGMTVQWTGPNGFTSSDLEPTISNISPAQAGDYSVVITMNGCASVPSIQTLSVNEIPSVGTISSNSPICNGTSILLQTNISCASYNWISPNGTNANLTSNDPFINIDAASADYLAGMWSVVCVSTDGCASANSNSIEVLINENPSTPVPVGASTVCMGETIQIQANTNDDANTFYTWYDSNPTTNPNAMVISNEFAPIFNNLDVGLQEYWIVSSSNTCTSAAAAFQFTVSSTPEIIVAENGGNCGQPIILTAEPSLAGLTYTYSWTGPSGFNSMEQNPIIDNPTIANMGTYQVTATDQNACTTTQSIEVNLLTSIPEIPSITTNGNSFCEGENLELNTAIVEGDNVTYTWFFIGDEIITTTTTTPSLVIDNLAEDANSGSYYVIVNVDGCNTIPSEAILVSVNSLLDAPTITTATNFCAGESIELSTNEVSNGTYFWSGPNGFTSNEVNPTLPNASENEAGTYNLFIQNGNCTSATTSLEVDVNPIPNGILVSNDGPVCAGSDFNLMIDNPVMDNTYNWYNEAGELQGTGQNILIENASETEAGFYYVVASNTSGCTYDPSDNITIETAGVTSVGVTSQVNFEANAGLDAAICDDVYVLNAPPFPLNSNALGEWSIINNSGTVNILSPVDNSTLVTNLESGENTFVWQVFNDACGLSAADTVVITSVNSAIAVDDTYQIPFNQAFDFNPLLNDTLLTAYHSLFDNNEPNNGELSLNADGTFTYVPDPSFYGMDEFTYTVCNEICPSDCVAANIFIETLVDTNCNPPDVITPNDDGLNDSFIVPCLENYPNSQLLVFNRWGDEVYRNANYQNDWYGTFENKDLPVGTYFYILEVNDPNGTAMQGYIYIQRE